MSNTISERVWQQGDLKPCEKFMLIALADRADDDGLCWPSYLALADMTGTTERQAIRNVAALKKAKHIMVWEQQGQRGGRGYTNIYFITIGLSDEEIIEIITRRFDLTPIDAEAIKSKKGDAYVTLSYLKRVTSETLLRTRKGDVDVTHKQKRVTCKAEKGDMDVTRTINNHVSNKHINNNARAKFAEYFSNNYGPKYLETTIALMQHHAVETKALIPENLKTFKRWGDDAYQILRLADFDLGKAKPLVTKCIGINRDGGYSYSEPKSILTTFRNELVAEQDGVSNNGRNSTTASPGRPGSQTARASPTDTTSQAANSHHSPKRGRKGILAGPGKR